MGEDEEILDLVNEHDEVIGQIKRSETSTLIDDGDTYVRAVNVFIVRADGRIWVPVRSMHKLIAPGGVDYSTGGHVAAEESYVDAAVREIREETRLTISPDDLELIARIPPAYSYFTHLFLLRSDVSPQLSDEHTSGSWLSVNELLAQLDAGVPAKMMLHSDVKRLKEYLVHKNRVHYRQGDTI